MTPKEILPGVLPLLKDLRQKGYKIGLGSSSKNAVRALRKVRILSYFNTIIDGTKTTRSKPDPQVFQMGAKRLRLSPNECIVFEDAQSGIEAALAGGFYAVGIGSPKHLKKAQLVLPSFENITIEEIIESIS